jgi:long-chain acyl-CoA synthetase
MANETISCADRPWLKSYKLGPYPLAKNVDYPKVPLYSFLDEAAEKYPTQVAILYQEKRLTYEELKRTVDKLAAALADLGVQQRDRVALFLPNCPQFIIGNLGILKAGGVTVPIVPLLKAPEVENQFNQSGAEVVICLDEWLPLIDSVKDKTRLSEIIITSRQDYSPEETAQPQEVAGTRHLRKLIAEYDAAPPIMEVSPMEDLATIHFTGGATGEPKGVMRTHYNDVAGASTLKWLLSPLEAGIRGKASILISTPLYHALGYALYHAAFSWGLRTIIVPDPRDVPALVETVREYRPYCIFAVPTQLMRWVQYKVGRLQSLVITTAAPLPFETARMWKNETAMPVTQGYGLTETYTCMIDLSAFAKIMGFMAVEKHSLGVPVPGLEVRLVDPDTGGEVPCSEVGEIHLRGPMVTIGYWPEPGSGLVDGWLHSGDLGWMDEDGYFYLVDRVKDMANVSGLKVYTCQVDDVLFKHPAVAMGIAIGIPDPEMAGSERIKAFIKLKEGFEGKVGAEDIIAHCRDHLPPYAAPRFVEFREDLPMTATEKLFKRALREEEAAKMKAQGEVR